MIKMAEVFDMKLTKCCCICNCLQSRRLYKLVLGGFESGLIVKFFDYNVLNAYLCGNCKQTLHIASSLSAQFLRTNV